MKENEMKQESSSWKTKKILCASSSRHFGGKT